MVENDPTSDLGQFDEWLTEGGLTLDVVRPHAGDALPADLDGYAALVVLGGEQNAYPDAGRRARRAVVRRRWSRCCARRSATGPPTLGICLGRAAARDRARGHRRAGGGRARDRHPARRQAGRRRVRPALRARCRCCRTCIQWHHDEVTELPLGAVLLAASTNYPVQAFRLGTAAWGVQFHPECDTRILAAWVDESGPLLADLGLTR